MNKLLFLFSLLICLKASAQPDIKHSIYFKDKKCNVYFNELGTYMYGHSKGSVFAIYVKINAGLPQEDSYFAKLDANMDTLWTKKYSGSEDDRLSFIRELPNGNLLLVGTTSSNDGDLWYGHSYSVKEIWMLEVDTFGHTIRHNTFGGSGAGWVHDVIVSSDGYIYMSGSCTANDYDFACLNYSSLDFSAWVAKYDTTFAKVWVKMYTGNGDDDITLIKEISPNSFILNYTTNSSSPEADPANAKGAYDMLALKIDGAGNTIWKRRYGSQDDEASTKSVIDPITKSIYFVGYSGTFTPNTWNTTGDVTYKSGSAWVLKIDTLGNIQGSKSYGAKSAITFVQDASFFQNHLYVFARSSGGGGDMDSNYGAWQTDNMWIGMVDTSANLVGKRTIQTYYSEYPQNSFIHNNELFVASKFGTYTNAYKCDTANWTSIIFNIGNAPLGIEEKYKEKEDLFDLSPNPTMNELKLTLKPTYVNESLELSIKNMQGEYVLKKRIVGHTVLDISTWPTGNYIVTLKGKKNSKQSKSFSKL